MNLPWIISDFLTLHRHHICKRDTRQPTQYESCEAQQVSVVFVFDLTPKANPLGEIRDDILLVDVPSHGARSTTVRYPSKAFLVVVNGNLRDPHDYSA